jgi:glucose-1-phosphate thymidylyltransferase
MNITKAILTGGGRATRLRPITTTINKHLLPLANKPMIVHAIEKVAEAGITDVYINVNPGETELQDFVGDGGRWGVRATFFEQTGGPQGIAHVVNEARRFIGDDPFLFYLSDNILLGGVKEMVDSFASGDYDCMLALSEVKDPQRFGVPVFDAAHRLVDVLEKPDAPPNNFAVTGIYLYGPKIFFETFPMIRKSARGEYEISSIHSHFLKTGRRVGHREITGWWKDTGKPDDLLLANQLLLDKQPASLCNYSPGVSIGAGTVVGAGVRLFAPVSVGAHCILEHCVIGPHASIASGCAVAGAEVRNSILLDNASVSGSFVLADSLIGKHAVIAKKSGAALAEPIRMIAGDRTVAEF